MRPRRTLGSLFTKKERRLTILLTPIFCRSALALNMPGPPLHSLVKYDTPSLLTTKGRGAKKGGAPGAKGGKKQLPPVEAKPQVTQTEDILNSILPPR